MNLPASCIGVKPRREPSPLSDNTVRISTPSSLLKVLLMPMDKERLEETAQRQGKPPRDLARELILDGLKKIKTGKKKE